MPEFRCPRPWLAGVCSRLASALHGHVWAIRAIWIVVLIVKPLIAIGAYLLLAILFELAPKALIANRETPKPLLQSPELAGRARRIAELHRRLGHPGGKRAAFSPPGSPGPGGRCGAESGRAAGSIPG